MSRRPKGVGPAPQPALPASAEEPIFRLEAGGPSSLVTGLAFAPDGQTLYVAGSDKIVRVWALDRAKGEFQLDRPATFRVPIGPGLDGAINSLAVSSARRVRLCTWFLDGDEKPKTKSDPETPSLA